MNRKTIVGVGVVIWSLMATLCGLAKNFTQLFLARGVFDDHRRVPARKRHTGSRAR